MACFITFYKKIRVLQKKEYDKPTPNDRNATLAKTLNKDEQKKSKMVELRQFSIPLSNTPASKDELPIHQ